jgi:hypothetical protein
MDSVEALSAALPPPPPPLADHVRSLLDLAPFPALAMDVRAPGLTLVYANDRFVQQTGKAGVVVTRILHCAVRR